MNRYKRIRELREDKDLRQKDIAAYLSCSQRVYSNYERGDLDIPTEVLVKLSKFHGVSVTYLLGLTDDMKRK
jgi:transcriptional regulator with XRE-family HTH domain